MHKIQDRDIEVLLRIYRWKGLTGGQIERLHFPSEQTAKVRIEKLIRYGLIKKYDYIPSKPIYALDSRGEALVKEYFESQGKWAKVGNIVPDRRTIQHHIETNDFRANLITAAEDTDLKCSLFLPYYWGANGSLKKITNLETVESTHDADGIFVLSRRGEHQLFFLEIDRGTQSIHGKFLEMVRFYQDYLIAEDFKTISTKFNLPDFKIFRLLIVTSSNERLNNIKKKVLKDKVLNPEAMKFFWITGSQVTDQNILSNIWEPLQGNKSYAIYK